MSNSKATGVAYADPEFESITVTGAQTFTGNASFTGNVSIGNSSTDQIRFYDATATTQPATIASVTTATLTSVTTAAASTTTPWGYTTSTQADAIVTLVNALATRATALTSQGNSYRTSLIALGLVAAT